MRKSLLAVLCLCLSSSGLLLAQNKTLGVGVTTPNANAALHVESPTGNQGFIMPRLTTAQRNAMTSLLTAADKGLMLYDTDLSTIYIWDGASWGSASEFSIDNPANIDDAVSALTVGSGNAGRFTINNTSSFAHAVYAESNGDSTAAAVHGNNTGQGFGVYGKSVSGKMASAAVYGLHVGTGDAAGAFRISNTLSTYSALYGETNGSGPAVFGNQIGLGRGGQFQITNAANTQAALRSYTEGTGNAGLFTINNVLNDSSAIYSTTNGTGAAGSFVATNTASTSPALFVESFGTGRVASFVRKGTGGGATVFAHVLNSGHGFWAEHEGTNGYAAILQAVNASNPNPAVFVEALGTGPSFFTQKSQATSTGDGIFSEHLGTAGSPGSFAINNAVNPSAGVVSTTVGSGPAILAENRGTANGFAGSFTNTDPGNTFPAIQASTAGTGSGVRVMQSAGPGPGMDVFMQNTASNAPGLAVDHQGVGPAGSFVISNGTSNASTLYTNSVGLGDVGFFQLDNVNSNNAAVKGRVINAGGVAGAFEIFDTSNPRSALNAVTQGTGNGANFNVDNASNGSSAIFASTNGTGNAISAQTSTGWTAFHARRDGASNGNAAVIEISDPANSFPALQANTAGNGGFAINARHTGATGDAIYGEHAGGTGSAGNFRISNATNTASAVYAATTAAGGNAVSVSNDADGIAFAIWKGGLQVTIMDVNTATIPSRASAFRLLSGGTTFTLGFPPVDGEVFMLYNETGVTITFSASGLNHTLLNGEGRTFIVFPGGAVRGF